mgnify:CR=1 FL=1
MTRAVMKAKTRWNQISCTALIVKMALTIHPVEKGIRFLDELENILSVHMIWSISI